VILTTDNDNTFFTIIFVAYNDYQLSHAAILYCVAGLWQLFDISVQFFYVSLV